MKPETLQGLLNNAEILGAKLLKCEYSDRTIRIIMKQYLNDNGLKHCLAKDTYTLLQNAYKVDYIK